MSQTHYYCAFNRKETGRIVDLTWSQFLKKFGWPRGSQWRNIGTFLAFAIDNPVLPDHPSTRELEPILSWTIRQTLPRMSPQSFCLLELSEHLGERSFVKVDVAARRLEGESDALSAAAVLAFVDGDIDDRTLWCVLTIHEQTASDLFRRWQLPMTTKDRQRVKAAMKRLGACRPVFEWQSVDDVRGGQTALDEADTRRFAAFIRLAWRKNWPLYSDGPRLLTVRDFTLARKLFDASAAMPGNCLLRYCGP